MKILQVIKKSSAIFLAVFLLVSSTGIELNAHYCKTKLVDVGIWSEAQSCSQTTELSKNQNETNTQTNISKQNCCNSKTVFSKTEVESELLLLNVNSVSNYHIAAVFLTPFVVSKTIAKPIGKHSPPLKFDRPILYQNFRI